MFLGKKGVNVVWVVLGAVLVLAVASTLVRDITFEKTILKYQINIEKLDTEMKQNMDRAIDTAIQTFADQGFSDTSNIWYCNHPFPPSTTEALTALQSEVQENVNEFLDNLAAQQQTLTYTVSAPEVELGGINPNGQEVDIRNLKLTIITEDKTQEKDASQTYDYGYRLWLIYDVLQEWMATDAGDIRNRIANLLNTNCAVDSCWCGDRSFSKVDSREVAEELDVDEEDIFREVDQSILALNDLFVNRGITGITCSYVVQGSPITDKAITTRYGQVENCVGTGYTYRTPEDVFYNAWGHGSFPNYNKCEFQWTNPSGPNYREKTLSIPGFSNIFNVVSMKSDDYQSIGNSGSRSVQWAVSVDKGVHLNYDVICEDATTYADTEEGTQPFSVKIGMLLSMILACGTEEPDRDCTGDGCVCIYGVGGAVAGGGVPGTPAPSPPSSGPTR